MNDKSIELLQQIAVDVAVIKNRLDKFEEVETKVDTHDRDLSEVKTQLNLVKWVGGVTVVSLVGVITRTFTGA